MALNTFFFQGLKKEYLPFLEQSSNTFEYLTMIACATTFMVMKFVWMPYNEIFMMDIVDLLKEVFMSMILRG